MSAQPQWQPAAESRRLTAASSPAAEPDPSSARILTAIALAGIGAGAVHVAAAATLGTDGAEYLAFFAVVAAAQIAWGVVALARAPRWWLALGALGNLLVLATWVVSRTVGLPVGDEAGIALPVAFPDALTAVLEAAIVLGAVTLTVRGQGPDRAATRTPAVTLAAAALVGALAVVGVLSQLGAIGALPAGS